MGRQDQVDCAYHCAQAMQEALDQLNTLWEKDESYVFRMRIGMHRGPAIVGSFGGTQRSDYTVVGHTVNIASRVESMAGPGDIVMTEALSSLLPGTAFESIGAFKVKGLELELPLFRAKKSGLGQVA